MSAMSDSMNLRPQEKRILVAIAVVVFVVLNLLLVVPHFQDYGKLQKELAATRAKIATNNAVIFKDTNEVDGYKKILRDLSKQPEGAVSFKEIQLEQTVTAQARANGIFIQTINNVAPQLLGPSSQSDQFFARQSVRIAVQATEDALVKFLYDVGNDPAMIRVWELTLNPLDLAQRYKLSASITLTADYQKNVATNAAPLKPAAPAKIAAQAPTSVPQRTGPTSAATNVNRAPAKKTLAPPTNPPVPARSPGPTAPARSAGPPVPGRTPRTPVQGKEVD